MLKIKKYLIMTIPKMINAHSMSFQTSFLTNTSPSDRNLTSEKWKKKKINKINQ